MNENASQQTFDQEFSFDFEGMGSFDDAVSRSESFLSETTTELTIIGRASLPYLTEAAIQSGSGLGDDIEHYDIMVESVYSSVVEKVRTWVAKAKAVFSTLVNKLKAQIALMTKKTDSWVKLVKPKLDKMTSEDAKKFTYTASPWAKSDLTKVSLDLPQAAADKGLKALEDAAKGITDIAAGKDFDGEAFTSKVLSSAGIKGKLENSNTGDIMRDVFGKDSLADALKDVKDTLKGTAAKKDITGFSEVGFREMLGMIEGTAKHLEAITKDFEATEKALGKTLDVYSKVKREADKINADDKNADKAESKRNAKSDVTKLMSFLIDVNGKIQGGYKQIAATHKALTEQQRNEYMKILTKFAKNK